MNIYIYTHFTLVRNIEICIYVCIQYTYMHQHKSRYIAVLVCSAGKRINKTPKDELRRGLDTNNARKAFMSCFASLNTHFMCLPMEMRLFTYFYPHSSGFGKVTVCSHVC